MAARLTRAKKRIRLSRIPCRVPPAEELEARLVDVLDVLSVLLATGSDSEEPPPEAFQLDPVLLSAVGDAIEDHTGARSSPLSLPCTQPRFWTLQRKSLGNKGSRYFETLLESWVLRTTLQGSSYLAIQFKAISLRESLIHGRRTSGSMSPSDTH